MSDALKFYLAGPMHGMTDAQILEWRERATKAIEAAGHAVTGPEYHGLEEDPADFIPRDKAQLASADIVLAWLPARADARGTVMEICLALAARKPVVVWGLALDTQAPWITAHCICYATLEEALHGTLEKDQALNADLITQVNIADFGARYFSIEAAGPLAAVRLYQHAARKTAIYPDMAVTMGEPTPWAYSLVGLAGEVGELCNLLKKSIRDHNGRLDDRTLELAEGELGGICWYLADLTSRLNLDLATIMHKNLQTLARRAEQGTLQGSGSER